MTGLTKTIKSEDGRKITLTGNALTFIFYKSYFGKDLLNDVINFARKNADSAVLAKMSKFKIRGAEDINSLDGEQQAELIRSMADFSFDTEFVVNFIAALMATARYPEKCDAMELIMEIPPEWVANQEFVSQLMEFLSLFISQKKTPRIQVE